MGKPNPLMMRTGLRILGVHSEEAVMVGDRMDTDIVAGIETGLDTVLVLSGVTSVNDIKKFPVSAAHRAERRGRYSGGRGREAAVSAAKKSNTKYVGSRVNVFRPAVVCFHFVGYFYKYKEALFAFEQRLIGA